MSTGRYVRWTFVSKCTPSYTHIPWQTATVRDKKRVQAIIVILGEAKTKMVKT